VSALAVAPARAEPLDAGRALRGRRSGQAPVRGARARPRGASAAARVGRAALLAAALAAVGVFHVWSRTRVTETGYALGEVTRTHARLASEHDRLRLEVETLRNPRTLEKFATRFGMAPPAPGTVWVAGPRAAAAAAGGAGVDGVGHRPAPAGPPHATAGRAAAGPAAAPGERLGLRGPRAGGVRSGRERD